jgi:hypothetical protein
MIKGYKVINYLERTLPEKGIKLWKNILANGPLGWLPA